MSKVSNANERARQSPFHVLLLFFACFAFFVYFGLLQAWKSIPFVSSFEDLAVIVVLGLFSVFVFSAAKCRLPFTSANLGQLHDILFALCTSLLWFVIFFPELNRPFSSSGDEGHHFIATAEYSKYLMSYLNGNIPKEEFNSFFHYRYTGYFYLVGSIFVNDIFGTLNSSFFQRLVLLVPYLGSGLLILNMLRAYKVYGVPKSLIVLMILTSPILLSFTLVKYIDIWQVYFLFLTFYFIWKNETVENSRYFLLIVISCSLLPLFRENILPTCVVIYCYLVFCIIKMPRTNWLRSFIALGLSVMPIFIFMMLKAYSGMAEAGRLSLVNVVDQDYSLFVLMLFFYIPFTFLALIYLFKSIGQKYKENVFVQVLLASLFVQAIVYFLFEPGWIPWTRNYLMLFPQLFLVSLLGCIHYYSSIKMVRVLLIFVLIANVFGLYALKNGSKYFFENEINTSYEGLANYISLNADKFEGQLIHSQMPNLYHPSLDRLGIRNKLSRKFERYASFPRLQYLSKGGKYYLFHWRESSTLVPRINQMPSIAKPNNAQLKGFNILYQYIDPWSNGARGYLLLEKVGKGA